jgi:hypothetical protein
MNANPLRETLRQMIAVLEAERQALAGLDLDAILCTATDKQQLCGTLDQAGAVEVDDECRGLLEAAKRMNEVNRQVRNLLAANVSARLETLTGQAPVYSAGAGSSRAAYSYAAARA